MNTNKQTLLSAPLTLKDGVEIKNRLFKSAMSEQLGDGAHNPLKGLSRLYEIWARGGIGISVTGNVMVDRSALGEPKNVVLDEKSDLSGFQAWAEAGKKNGSQIWMQLNHPGKQTPKFLTKKPVAPSAVPLGKGLEKSFNPPRELTEKEITDIAKKFGTSAGLAKQTGFSGVQIHGAHGYLVSQFLSPHHNQRTDSWGGSLKNRMRFVLLVLKEIREAVGDDYPVGIKLNSADFMKGGFSRDDSMAVARQLEKEGIDLVEISGGTYESPSMTGHKIKESTLKREAYFLAYAEQLRDVVDIPLVVTGGFRTASAMNDALESNATDMIGLARPMAIEPEFPNRILQDSGYGSNLKDPSTGVRAVDRMAMLSITWYEIQLEKIAKGHPPDPNLNAWLAVMMIMKKMGAHAFLKRRA